MLFNSFNFIFLFLPLVFLVLYWAYRHSRRAAVAWLVFASLAFYAAWDFRFVALLVASASFNYAAGRWIGRSRPTGSVIALAFAIAINLTLLGYFKYADFFLQSVDQLFGLHNRALELVLPLGISFFTFTQIAFLVDVHKGIAREYDFLDYLLFVTYFPHLIAGPILHHKQMMPQFARLDVSRLQTLNLSAGLTIFILGLAKKVIIADGLSEYATPIFDAASNGSRLMLLEAWAGALSYTLQLYFDFSGYSDMAIGLSLMFNIRLPVNFNSPYKARSIIDFWRRWHITLSSFLRDYLYIPLGGNRHGRFRRHVNVMLTMLLGGLWHGAGWTFVIWGGMHGVFLVINQGWRELKSRRGWGPGGWLSGMASAALTFVSVVAAWVLFRAENVDSAKSMLIAMAGGNGLSVPQSLQATLSKWPALVSCCSLAFKGWLPVSDLDGGMVLRLLCVGFALVWCFPNTRQLFAFAHSTWEDTDDARALGNEPQAVSGRQPMNLLSSRSADWVAAAVGLLFLITLAYMASGKPSEFLYYQF